MDAIIMSDLEEEEIFARILREERPEHNDSLPFDQHFSPSIIPVD
jgi:hypothetical protein